MEEIDIIKYILLDDDALNLVNFISKPTIAYNFKNNSRASIDRYFKNNEDDVGTSELTVKALKMSFSKLSSKSDLNYMEKRILKMFEMQIKDIIN